MFHFPLVSLIFFYPAFTAFIIIFLLCSLLLFSLLFYFCCSCCCCYFLLFFFKADLQLMDTFNLLFQALLLSFGLQRATTDPMTKLMLCLSAFRSQFWALLLLFSSLCWVFFVCVCLIFIYFIYLSFISIFFFATTHTSFLFCSYL